MGNSVCMRTLTTEPYLVATGAGAERAFQVSMIDQSQPRSKLQPELSLDEARLRQQALGAKLRQMFNDVVNEPVPDDFLEILRKADRKAGE